MKFNFYLVVAPVHGGLSYNPVLEGDSPRPCVTVEADNLTQAIKGTFQVRPELPFTELVFEDREVTPGRISIVNLEPEFEPFDMELTVIPFTEDPDQSDFVLVTHRMKLMTRIGDQRPARHMVVINSLSGSMIEMMGLHGMMAALKKHDYI